ncbi:MAG: hypothetical protein WDZ39_01825 [Candidatus Spechtbacterales bacterium]
MWDKLKKILDISNDRAVIVEDGEPRYVILSVDEYLKMLNKDSANLNAKQDQAGAVNNPQGSDAGSVPNNLNEGENEQPGTQSEATHGLVGGMANPSSASGDYVNFNNADHGEDMRDFENEYSVKEASAGINLEDLPV